MMTSVEHQEVALDDQSVLEPSTMLELKLDRPVASLSYADFRLIGLLSLESVHMAGVVLDNF